MLLSPLPASLWRIFLAPSTATSPGFWRYWHAPAVAIFSQVLLVERTSNAEKGNLFNQSLVSRIQKLHQMGHTSVILDEFPPVGLHKEQCKKCRSSHLLRCAWLRFQRLQQRGNTPCTTQCFIGFIAEWKIGDSERSKLLDSRMPLFRNKGQLLQKPWRRNQGLSSGKGSRETIYCSDEELLRFGGSGFF